MPDRHDTALTAAAWATFALCLAIAAAPAVSGPFPSATRGLHIPAAGPIAAAADRGAATPASLPRQEGQP